MAVELRDFPSYTWVCKLNEKRKFSGSLGTNGRAGQFTVHIFNYKLWKKEVKDEEGNSTKYLCVSCSIQPPENSHLEPFGQDECQFDFSEASIELAKQWLQEKYAQHIDVIGKE